MNIQHLRNAFFHRMHVLVLLAAGFALFFGESINLI